MKEEDRKALINHRISKADDAVRDVEFLIKSKRPLLATNRIYYGIFYILSALSLKHDFHTSKHQQLIGWFNKEFVASGRLDSRYGKIIHNAFKNRSTGDYDDFAEFDEEEVKDSFEEMKEFIDAIRSML
jgi:uncharacterized protein (UPF0332 family)